MAYKSKGLNYVYNTIAEKIGSTKPVKIKVNNSLLYFDIDNPCLVPATRAMQALPVMIVLHGGPGYDQSPYRTFFNDLHDCVQVIYIDIHGNGRSDPGNESEWNFERWTSDLNEFCQLLNIEKPIIFGHSFGAMVAMEFAAKYSNKLSKLILCTPMPKFDEALSAEKFLERGGEKAKQTFLNFIADPITDKENYSTYCSPYYGVTPIDEKAIFYDRLILKMDILLYFFKTILPQYDFINSDKTIKAPTLIISGEQDPIATIEMNHLLADKLGDACVKHYIIPDAGHNILWEKNELVLSAMRQFIDI